MKKYIGVIMSIIFIVGIIGGLLFTMGVFGEKEGDKPTIVPTPTPTLQPTVTPTTSGQIEVTLNKTSMSLEIGESETLEATVIGSDKQVTWVSSNSNIATVDENGKVVAKAVGTAIIIGKIFGGKVGTCTVVVNGTVVTPTSISISKTMSIYVGKSANLPVTIVPNNATNKEFQCISLNSNIVSTVKNNDSCLIKGEKEGTAEVKVVLNDLVATSTIIVQSNDVTPTSISLSADAIKLSVGGTSRIESNVLPADATVKKVNWSSDNSSIVSVDENGQISAKKAGIAVIKAETINGKEATVSVIVTGSSLIAEYDSPTLKYYIEKAGTYHNNTYIWVKDAYSQFKVAITEPQNNNSLTPRKAQNASAIINYLLKTNNYSSKGLIIANGGGMVSKKFNTGAPSYWFGTSAIPLVLHNGTVIRDSSGEKLVAGTKNIIYGMKKDGSLAYYNYKMGNSQEERNYNKDLFQRIRNEGVLYTFGFRPVLIENGVVKASETDNNIRQGLCQIDKNNFIIVTNTNKTNNRGVGFSPKSLADYMKSMNCKMALNLDGGGSTSFYYKKKNESPQKVNTPYDGRDLSDMIYFVEQ